MSENNTILILDTDTVFVDLIRRSPETTPYDIIAGDPKKAGYFIAESQPLLTLINPALVDWPKLVEQIPSHHAAGRAVALIDSDPIQRAMRKLGTGTVDKRQGISSLMDAIRFFSELPAHASTDAERILVADDEDDIRRMLSEFLTTRGYTPIAVRNGKEALNVVDLEPSIPVVLMDVTMPVAAGIDTLVKIMKRKPHPSVVMMSALADTYIAQQALKLGALSYIVKPLDLAEVESAISVGSSGFELRGGHH